MNATAIKLMKQKWSRLHIYRHMYRLEEREKKRKRIDKAAAESRKSRGKGRAVSEQRGSRSREIGVKTGEDERAAEEEKYSRDRRGTSTETGWQDIKVSIRG